VEKLGDCLLMTHPIVPDCGEAGGYNIAVLVGKPNIKQYWNLSQYQPTAIWPNEVVEMLFYSIAMKLTCTVAFFSVWLTLLAHI
jgi:hypothetical protein